MVPGSYAVWRSSCALLFFVPALKGRFSGHHYCEPHLFQRCDGAHAVQSCPNENDALDDVGELFANRRCSVCARRKEKVEYAVVLTRFQQRQEHNASGRGRALRQRSGQPCAAKRTSKRAAIPTGADLPNQHGVTTRSGSGLQN